MKKIYSIFVTILLVGFTLTIPIQAKAKDGQAISKDGVPISFSVFGEGEPTLVFVHGWSCDRSVWENQVPYFEKKHRVITMDLAGHGASGRERTVYSLSAFGEDVAAVAKAAGASKVILIGHSMGGPVILEAAKIMPDQVIAIVGIDTMQNFEEEYTQDQVQETMKPFKEDFKNTVNSFIGSMFVPGTDPKFIEQISQMMSNADPRVGVSALEEMLSASYVKNPPKINVPVWALNADLWPTKPEVNRKYVDFNLRIMPGVGHFLMMEKPDVFNKQLDDIINK